MVSAQFKLALLGGTPVRRDPFPGWPVFNKKEEDNLREVLLSGNWGGCAWHTELSSTGKRIYRDYASGRYGEPNTKAAEFARKFANYHGARYGLCVMNGTTALEIALKAVGIEPGDEVIVPPYTWIASASCVLLVGAIPVFVDIDLNNYCLDPNNLEDAITPRTKAIIPVHLGGRLADMDAIMDIAKRNRLAVVEDCAHVHGSSWKNQGIGSIGDIGCFSFQSSKAMTCGEGGIIITNNEDLWRQAFSLCDVGKTLKEKVGWEGIVGWNYRITEFQAAILLAQLDRLEEQTKIREANANYLNERLGQIEGIEPLDRDPRVTRQNYYAYIFKYKKEKFSNVSRRRFVEAMNAEGIPCYGSRYEPVYKSPLFYVAGGDWIKRHFPQGKNFDYSKIHCPVAEKACYEEAVWIMHEVLLGSKKDIEDIVQAARKTKQNTQELCALSKP